MLLDDRPKVSPGVKFKDAELIGVPTIVVVGKGLAEGIVEVRDRRSGERVDVPADDVAAHLVAAVPCLNGSPDRLGGDLRLGRHADALAHRRPCGAVARLRRAVRPSTRTRRHRWRSGSWPPRTPGLGAAQERWSSARLAEVLADAGVDTDHPGHDAALTAYEEFWEPHTFTDPDVPPLFAGLRERGIRVGVLSNTIWSREYHEQVFARDGVLDLIDGAVYTSEIAHAKPHRESFVAAAAAVGVSDLSGCVYVGDRPFEDVHGAQRAGMRAMLVPHSDIPPAQAVPVEVHPDGVAHRLLDVLGITDGWR